MPRRYKQGADGQPHPAFYGKLPEEFSKTDTMRFMVETDLKLSGCVSADTLAALRAEGYDYKDGNLVPAGKEETMQEKVADATPAAPLKLDVSVRVIEPVKNLMGFASVKFNDCFPAIQSRILAGKAERTGGRRSRPQHSPDQRGRKVASGHVGPKRQRRCNEMAYVPVPKDLSKIKTKLAFNLTKRQLICFSGAAAVGLPAYLFSRGSIGNSAAMFLMIGLMLPFFFFAMYERDGLPLEKVLKNIIRTRFLYPRVRPYKTENFYALLGARKEAQPIAKQQKGRKARRQKA